MTLTDISLVIWTLAVHSSLRTVVPCRDLVAIWVPLCPLVWVGVLSWPMALVDPLVAPLVVPLSLDVVVVFLLLPHRPAVMVRLVILNNRLVRDLASIVGSASGTEGATSAVVGLAAASLRLQVYVKNLCMVMAPWVTSSWVRLCDLIVT